MALCLCFAAIASYSATVWSSDVAFDGTPTSEPVVVQPTDTIGYSTAIEDGNGKGLSITAIRDKDPLDQTVIVNVQRDPSDLGLIEGTANWEYNPRQYTLNEGYVLQERIDTSTTPSQGKTYSRTVKVLPEPAVLMILGFFGLLFFRRYAKKLLVILAVCALGSTMAHAETTVSSVSCLQLWPIHREVVINYTVSSDYSGEGDLTIKFYGSTDEGVTTFDLSTKGTLTKDGASGTITPGTHKTIWTPDSTLNNVTGTIRVGVEVEEPTPPTPSTYMIIDVSGGYQAQSYPVSYTDEEPSGGWNVNEYKTTKIVLKYCPPGTFKMGSPDDELGRQSDETQRDITLTKGFYVGIFEVTDQQYGEIYNGNWQPGYETLAKSYCTYQVVRGSEWPSSTTPGANSFLGKLNSRTGLSFDLPTEAQWEYACRGGTTRATNRNKDLSSAGSCPEMDEVANYLGEDPELPVGSHLPNFWGLYDMHGNISEYCLDYYGPYDTTDVIDPIGPTTVNYRVVRGGNYDSAAKECRSASRLSFDKTSAFYCGFRLFMVVD